MIMLKRLAYGLMFVILTVGLALEVHEYHQWSLATTQLIRQGLLPPRRTPRAFPVHIHIHTSASRTIQGVSVRLPADTVLAPNWSGWVTGIPRGGAVRSIAASFRIPNGLHPSPNHNSALAFWVGTGGLGTPAILLQSGLSSYIDLQSGGAVPSQGFLEDCSSNVACLAHLSTAPFTPIQAGDTVTVRLHFTPWGGPMSWFGFWMDTRIIIARRHHVVQSWTGRMYLPPWAADPTSVETIVEAMGNPTTNVTALPNGDWRVPVTWQVRLQHPWPSRTWPHAHLVHIVATGWYPRKGVVTHVTTQSLQFSSDGETGRGVVSYNDGGRP